MSQQLTEVDSSWAWSAYEPTERRPWTRRLAAHLYRRAGFAATSAELDAAVKRGPGESVRRLCAPPPAPAGFEDASAALAERVVLSGDTQHLAAWWLHRMLSTPDPLLEKLTLFWHGHFATSAEKVDKPRMMLEQNALLRSHAKGKFEELVRGIARDPAMLIYLDSTTNRRIYPNENFARELMELFTLGVGNYSEREVKEVARAFTGWEVMGDRFQFNAIQHDHGSKSFLGRSGDFDGDEAIRIVLNHPVAARFIARKLVRFFVLDEPAVPDALIEPLARDLREHQFEIGRVVRTILGSNLFFSEHAVGRKVRSPVELGVGLLRALGASTNLLKLAQGLADIGQSLFHPPNVKGWDGGRAWINSSTLLGRANLVRQLMTASETHYSAGSLDAVADAAGADSPAKRLDWLLELLVATDVPSEAREALVRLAEERGRSIADVVHAIGTLPEFQLS